MIDEKNIYCCSVAVIQSNLNDFEKMSSKKFNDRIWRIDMEKHDVVVFRPYPFEKGQKLHI